MTRTRSRSSPRRWWPAAAADCGSRLEGGAGLSFHDHPLLQPTGDLDGGEYLRLASRVAGGDLLLEGAQASG